MLRTFAVAALLCAAAGFHLCFAMPKPPENAVIFQHGQTSFYAGMVSVNSQADTVKLKDLGFCNLSFEGRSFRSMKYHCQWPASVVEMPMPDYLNGMDYDVEATPDDWESNADALTPERIRPTDMTGIPELKGEAREEWVRQHTTVRIQCYPRPAGDKPDTVVAGKNYVHGLVELTSLADSAGLLPFGFFGFDSNPKPGSVFGREESESYGFGSTPHEPGPGYREIKYYRYHAYWPMDVAIQMLPETVYGLYADHTRGAKMVVIERKMPTP